MLKKIDPMIFLLIAISIFIGFVVRLYAFSFYRIEGQSMSPTFLEGERVFAIKKPLIDVLGISIRPGDIAVFKTGEKRKIIKRIYAFENDQIWIDQFNVYVNNENVTRKLGLKYDLQKRIDCKYSEVYDVPKGRIFVLGDNLCSSADSRFIGAVEARNIEAIVFKSLWER